MKIWTLRLRAKDVSIFEEIRSGIKEYETRAATIRYQPIQEGDTLIFVCGKDRFSKKISMKFHWPDIDSMVKEIPFKKIMPSVSSIDEMKKIYGSYPNYLEKIKEFGLLGFKLK